VIRSEPSGLKRLVDDLQKVSRARAHQLDLHPMPTGELVKLTELPAGAGRLSAGPVRAARPLRSPGDT
jgi:hypothetical protein